MNRNARSSDGPLVMDRERLGALRPSSRLGCRVFKRVLRGIVNVTPKTSAAARMLMQTVRLQ